MFNSRLTHLIRKGPRIQLLKIAIAIFNKEAQLFYFHPRLLGRGFKTLSHLPDPTKNNDFQIYI